MVYASDVAVATMVRAAVAGDERGWNGLVRRFDGMLRGIARGYGLRGADVEDVVQTTWLRAVCHLHRVNEPAAVSGWLAVTARREAVRTLQRGVREVLVDDPEPAPVAGAPTPETQVIEREERRVLRGAVRRLPGRQRDLLDGMLQTPGLSYQELSARLGMPVGSIGPTRERAFGRLREDARLRDISLL